MLDGGHPLRSAQDLLLAVFRNTPEDHWIEFRAIKNANAKQVHGEKKARIECCQVRDLEKSIDLVLAEWIAKTSRDGYDVFYGVCPRGNMRRTANGLPLAGKNEDVSRAG